MNDNNNKKLLKIETNKGKTEDYSTTVYSHDDWSHDVPPMFHFTDGEKKGFSLSRCVQSSASGPIFLDSLITEYTLVKRWGKFLWKYSKGFGLFPNSTFASADLKHRWECNI